MKRVREVVEAPRRQSARLKNGVVNPYETAAQKRQREVSASMTVVFQYSRLITLQEEEKKKRQIEEQERLEAEEKARLAKRPRHQELDLTTLGDKLEEPDLSSLRSSLQAVTNVPLPKRAADADAFVFDEDQKNEAEVEELRNKLQKLRIVSRAKVTADRVYSAAYHPDVTKDLVFFGGKVPRSSYWQVANMHVDKHGQIGIWDARAPVDEVEDEGGDISADHREGGKHWRLQCHWPASSTSSISSIKFDPVDAHSVRTQHVHGMAALRAFYSYLRPHTMAQYAIFLLSRGFRKRYSLQNTSSQVWIFQLVATKCGYPTLPAASPILIFGNPKTKPVGMVSHLRKLAPLASTRQIHISCLRLRTVVY